MKHVTSKTNVIIGPLITLKGSVFKTDVCMKPAIIILGQTLCQMFIHFTLVVSFKFKQSKITNSINIVLKGKLLLKFNIT